MTDQLDPPTPIRSDLPLDIHPDSLGGPVSRALNQPDTVGVHTLSAGREALKAVYENLGLLADAERSQHKVLTPAQQKQALKIGQDVRMIDGRPVLMPEHEDTEFHEAAKHAFNKIAPQVDRRMKELRAHEEIFAKRVAEAIDHGPRKTQEGLALAAEVRAHIKVMSPAERTNFVVEAVNAGDKATVAAILHAQPFLSGLDQAMYDNLRQRAALKFAPVDAAQHEATQKVIAKVMDAGNKLMQRYTAVLNRQPTHREIARAKVKALQQTK